MITNLSDIIQCLLRFLNNPTTNADFLLRTNDTWNYSIDVISNLLEGCAYEILELIYPLLNGNYN